MPILERDFITKLKRNAVFLLIYCLIFLFIYFAFPYIAPFFLAIIIAFIIKPISTKLYHKFNINKGASTLILSFLAVAIVITLTSVLVVNLASQMMLFINNASTGAHVFDLAETVLDKANMIISDLNSVTNINLMDITSKFSGNLMNMTKGLLTNIINLATSIPYIAMFTATLFVATYFISRDLDSIENAFYSMFTEQVRSQVFDVKAEVGVSIFGYVKAYLILMSITGCAIFISFVIFGLPYGIMVGIIGALLDLIPFLGIISIYLPIIVYYIVMKNYFVAIGMGVVFLLISLLRQIIEPKLLSVNIGMHPLSILAAIFIGIQLKGVIGIFFCLGLVVFHNILKKVSIL